MGYNLYICEKPSQAADLARNLNAKRSKKYYATTDDKIRVTWCLGHLLELCPPEAYDPAFKQWRLNTLPIIPSKFKYEVKTKTKEQYKVVSSLIKEASCVTIATDYDREGEAIARTLIDRTHYKGPLKRLCLTALDDKSIKRALNNILDGKITEPLYAAAVARSEADWLVGMNLSRLFTLLTRNKGTNTLISVGRVQTPTITLVTERDKAIEDFKPTPFYDLYVDLITLNNHKYRAIWIPNENVTDEDGHVLNKEVVQEVAQRTLKQNLEVTAYNTQKSKQAPMLPYDLTSLQQFCNRRFGFSASKTLSIAQSLYEKHKATSYPRTDCRYLPTSQLSEVPEIFNTLKAQDNNFAYLVDKADSTKKPRCFNQSKITAHHAIIPTGNPNVILNHMSAEELKVYDAIRRAYLASFFEDAIYERTEINLTHDIDQFKAISRVLFSPGWRELFGAKKGDAAPENNTVSPKQNSEKTSEEVQSDDTYTKKLSLDPEISSSEDQTATNQADLKLSAQLLPYCKVGDLHFAQDVEVKDKMTTPPSHYTEATLLSAMENIHRLISDPKWKKMLKETAGLGTPATRAQIIESAVTHEYLERKGKYILSTNKARFMTNVIPSDIRSAGMTAVWEQALDSIAKNQMDTAKFMASIIRWINHCIATNQSLNIEPSSLINNITQDAHTKNGSLKQTNKISTPKRRTRTKTTSLKNTTIKNKVNTNQSAPTFSTNTSMSTDKACPLCGSQMVLRYNKTTNESFYGCPNFPSCRGVLPLNPNNNRNDKFLTELSPNSHKKSVKIKRNVISSKDKETTKTKSTKRQTKQAQAQGSAENYTLTQVAPETFNQTTKDQSSFQPDFSTSSNSEIKTCPKCGSLMVLRHNKTTGEAFLGCSAFPKCRTIISLKTQLNQSQSQPPHFGSKTRSKLTKINTTPAPLDQDRNSNEYHNYEIPDAYFEHSNSNNSTNNPNFDPNYVPPSEDDYPW